MNLAPECADRLACPRGPARRARRRISTVLLAVLPLCCDGPGDRPGRAGGAAPPRILSASPELTPLLVDLGLAPAVVAAAAPLHPALENAVDLAAVGPADLELGLALRPDVALVLATPAGVRIAERLAARGMEPLVLAPRSPDELIAAIRRLGGALDRERRADVVVARLLRDIARIATARDGLSRLRVAWILEREPLVVVGGTGPLHEVLELAGAENAIHDRRDERVSLPLEELAARAPERIVDTSLGASSGRSVPGLGATPMLAVPPELAALPSVDLLERIERLHETLYPDAPPAP